MANMNNSKHSRHNPARKANRAFLRDMDRAQRRLDKQSARKTRRSRDYHQNPNHPGL